MLNITERPLLFSDMVGQELILKDFINRSKLIDFPSYMMLTGESGSGKTTSAYIIAKLLNCSSPLKTRKGYYEPCNKCAACKDINNLKFRRDVVYIDASTLNKDSVLELKNKLNKSSFFDKNRIYIIDEAHLIASGQAKSAFLTMCEEIRSNTYLILTTTDISKFDKAFLRRFRKYDFRKIESESIAEYLVTILRNKNLFESLPEDFIFEGIFQIADFSDGSPGVALDLLERCIKSELYTIDLIEAELGQVSNSNAFDILKKLLDKDISGIDLIKKYNNEEVYKKTRYILLDTIYNDLGGFKNSKTNKNFAKEVKSYSKNSLLACYANVYNQGYFDFSEFLFNLLKYYNNKETNKIQRVRRSING